MKVAGYRGSKFESYTFLFPYMIGLIFADFNFQLECVIALKFGLVFIIIRCTYVHTKTN